MGRDAIVSFADEKGMDRRKPPLKEVLTGDQIDQIKFARTQGVTWPAIAKYFKEGFDLDYSESTYQALVRSC